MDPVILTFAKEAIELTADMPGGGLASNSLILEIAREGSERYFLRISDDRQSVVAMIQASGGKEFSSYIRIGDFLRINGIRVPDFYGTDLNRGILVMEDLGPVHLEDALTGCSAEEELSFYRGCMDILFRFQTTVSREMEKNSLLDNIVFAEETLLVETEYFEKEFIGRFCPAGPPVEWNAERQKLAKLLSAETPVFMHRDFQSRNIMVKAGELRLIDFQAAHRGPGLYDTASLLKDPYHRITPGTRKTLLMELYYRLREAGSIDAESFDEYYEAFLIAGIQRNLQALAAFAFLGYVKRKSKFLDSIPDGLDLLEEGIDESGGFPAIRSIIHQARENPGV